MKKRLMKKYLKRISDGQRLNKQVPFFYVSQAKKIVDDYLEWFHFSVFRPWWYQQDWKEMDFAKTITEQYKSAEDEFQSKWSIDLMALSNEYKSRKRVQTRRPGKPKPEPPVRRLRNPEIFSIRLRSGEWYGVEGEVAFEHQGYKFFIYHTGLYWSVADVVTGALIKSAETYKKAVNQARERIMSNFDSYLKITEKTLVH